MIEFAHWLIARLCDSRVIALPRFRYILSRECSRDTRRMARITFLGAAQSVTGSRFLVEAGTAGRTGSASQKSFELAT